MHVEGMSDLHIYIRTGKSSKPAECHRISPSYQYTYQLELLQHVGKNRNESSGESSPSTIGTCIVNVESFPDLPTFERKSQIRMGLLVTTITTLDIIFQTLRGGQYDVSLVAVLIIVPRIAICTASIVLLVSRESIREVVDLKTNGMIR